MIDVQYIKERFAQKVKDNTKNGKIYKIDFEKQRVIKIRPNRKCNLETAVMIYLCEQYRKLGIDIVYDVNDNYVTVDTPFLDCLHENTKYTKDQIIKNTSIYLQNFTDTNPYYKDLLVDDSLYIQTHQDNWDPHNYFLWNNEIYLLDLESFYFTVHMPNGINAGKYGIKQEYQDEIHEYQMPQDIRYAIKDENMLVY